MTTLRTFSALRLWVLAWFVASMGVAIAFAVSWKPFVKSKNSASRITSTTMRIASSTRSLSSQKVGQCVDDVDARTKSSRGIQEPATGR